MIGLEELVPTAVPTRERVSRRIDLGLDKRLGFYPLAIRHSLRHGFHKGRWASGHTYPFLDSDRAGPLPRWKGLKSAMARWHLSSRRYVPAKLLRRMRADCDAVVFTNPQTQASTPFLAAARRLDLPDDRLHRELGPSRRKRRRVAVPRHVRRPERDHA